MENPEQQKQEPTAEEMSEFRSEITELINQEESVKGGRHLTGVIDPKDLTTEDFKLWQRYKNDPDTLQEDFLTNETLDVQNKFASYLRNQLFIRQMRKDLKEEKLGQES